MLSYRNPTARSSINAQKMKDFKPLDGEIELFILIWDLEDGGLMMIIPSMSQGKKRHKYLYKAPDNFKKDFKL